jgi:hypothetical protein
MASGTSTMWRGVFASGLCAALTSAGLTASGQQPPLPSSPDVVFSESSSGMIVAPTPQSNAYPKGDYYSHLMGSSGGCSNGACDWGWGCGGSPHRTGPGSCDTWKVGPRWRVGLDGVIMQRDTTNLDALVAAATPPFTGDQLRENFDYGGGARLTIASDWPKWAGYEMAVDYIGVPEWNASVFVPDVPPLGPIAGVNTQRELTYRSAMHSLAINFQESRNRIFKPFLGVRYVLLDEDLDDETDQFAPAVVGALTNTTDIARAVDVQNHLIGFQGGLRGDLWNRGGWFSVQGMIDGGAYCNLSNQNNRFRQTTSTQRLDDPNTAGNEFYDTLTSVSNEYKQDRARVAFLGEASLAAVAQLNRCTSLRAGYQVLYLEGVELGDTAFLGNGPSNDDLLLHGWFAGFEYRR